MTILLINNAGNGFAGRLAIPEGTTVRQLFADHVGNPDTTADRFRIRVNTQPVSLDTVLVDGDRVVISPRKIEGA